MFTPYYAKVVLLAVFLGTYLVIRRMLPSVKLVANLLGLTTSKGNPTKKAIMKQASPPATQIANPAMR
jgi:hypothetical protein